MKLFGLEGSFGSVNNWQVAPLTHAPNPPQKPPLQICCAVGLAEVGLNEGAMELGLLVVGLAEGATVVGLAEGKLLEGRTVGGKVGRTDGTAVVGFPEGTTVGFLEGV
jgi:hypothetical protein